jgi:DNA-binding beta-propeller fold protein YncE
VRSRTLLFGIAAAALLQVAALPSPPWRSLRPGTIATVLGGQALPATLAPDALALYGVTGLETDLTDGSVYMIDRARSTIFRIDPGGTSVTLWAGAPSAGFNGDDRPALETAFHMPSDLALEPRTGEIFVADTLNHRIRAISPDRQRVRTVAGLGVRGTPPEQLPTEAPAPDGLGRGHFSGDGGPAVEAELSFPSGVAVDGLGLLFIADSGNHRIRMVNRGTSPVIVCTVEVLPGQIVTVAGTGTPGFSGDGGPATRASLSFPTELDLDAAGNLYVLDAHNHRIRKIDRQTGRIRTLAAALPKDADGAGGAAPPSPSITGLGVTSTQELIYANRHDRSIHRVDRGGVDHPLFAAFDSDAGLGSVAVGSRDEVYVADEAHNRVLKIEGGQVRPITGGGGAVPSRVPLKEAELSLPGAVAADAFGNVFLADELQHSVRRILMAERVVETLMGTGTPGTGGDGGPPQMAELMGPTGIQVDGDWSYYITDRSANLVRRVSMSNDGLRTATFAGDRRAVGFEEGKAATATRLGSPFQAARHPLTGEVYISCQEGHAIRKVDRQGRITTVAGTGTAGFAGDGGPARRARLNGPAALAFDRQGNLYVADKLNHRIRRIDGQGHIASFAGTGERGYAGDGGAAALARLNNPDSLLFDEQGNLYFADTNNHAVRRIDAAAPHRIDTVVGTGQRGYSGDGGPARQAQLNLPRGLALSRDGFLYISDSLNRRLRVVKLPV